MPTAKNPVDLFGTADHTSNPSTFWADHRNRPPPHFFSLALLWLSYLSKELLAKVADAALESSM